MSPRASRLWAIVLPAGDELQPFLQRQCEEQGNPQCCGHQSVLQHTVARVEQLIPRERILIVVSQEHEKEAAQQLAGWPTDNRIVQPLNGGTAPGILLALAHLSHRDSFALVAVFPGNLSVPDEEHLIASVRQAAEEAQRYPRQLTVLGMPPETAPHTVQNGSDWIEPETVMAGLSTAIYVAGTATLWEMVRQTQPELYWDFRHLRRVCDQPHAADVTEGIYAFLPSQSRLDFLSAVCQQLPQRLRVCPIPAVERRQEL